MDQNLSLPVFDIPHYNKFFKEENQRKNWYTFFKYFNDIEKYKILDFGCGAGWSIRIGTDFGYNIMGLDTNAINKFSFNLFQKFRKALGVDPYVKIYDGIEKLPFDDNEFNLIVCRASFNKFHNINVDKNTQRMALNRLEEFSRILTGERIVVITGSYFKEEFKQFDFKVFNWSKKRITRIWS